MEEKEKRKIEPNIRFREYMIKHMYHHALFLLTEIKHPSLLELFPRVTQDDVEYEMQPEVEITQEDIAKLKRNIFWTRIGRVIMSLFSFIPALTVTTAIIGGIVFYNLEDPMFILFTCIGLMLLPVIIIPTYAGTMLLWSELKSKFYSVI